MNTTADLSILTLIANASLVVKAVLAILIVLSLASWTVIFQKFFQQIQLSEGIKQFSAQCCLYI